MGKPVGPTIVKLAGLEWEIMSLNLHLAMINMHTFSIYFDIYSVLTMCVILEVK